MEQLLEHFAIGVAAIGGVLAARGKRVDLFGVVVLALVTAYGGVARLMTSMVVR